MEEAEEEQTHRENDERRNGDRGAAGMQARWWLLRTLEQLTTSS
jgi:hypothetical protein